mmetsp:Transcript_33012/g.37882  ORF Transcript_33012/g.37882 Transcript_33012/m.37882 type:complete len:120 (-) Transcript_33012:714-1073(-)
MLWEVAVLNKMYKTKDFRKIKSRAVIGKVLYIVTADNSAGSKLESIREDEMKMSEDEHNLFVKYGCEDLSVHKGDIPFYSRLLYFYDCVNEVAQDVSEISNECKEQIRYWTGTVFRYLH